MATPRRPTTLPPGPAVRPIPPGRAADGADGVGIVGGVGGSETASMATAPARRRQVGHGDARPTACRRSGDCVGGDDAAPARRRPGSPASALRRPARRRHPPPLGRWARPASASAACLTGPRRPPPRPPPRPPLRPPPLGRRSHRRSHRRARRCASGRQARLDLAAAAVAVSLSRVNLNADDADRQPAAPAAASASAAVRPPTTAAAPAAAAASAAATPPPVKDEAAFLAAPDAAEPTDSFKVSMPSVTLTAFQLADAIIGGIGGGLGGELRDTLAPMAPAAAPPPLRARRRRARRRRARRRRRRARRRRARCRRARLTARGQGNLVEHAVSGDRFGAPHQLAAAGVGARRARRPVSRRRPRIPRGLPRPQRRRPAHGRSLCSAPRGEARAVPPRQTAGRRALRSPARDAARADRERHAIVGGAAPR